MEVKGKKIGFVLTGSFYNFKNVINQIKKLKELEADILPILSFNSYNLDTSVGKPSDYIEKIEKICEKEIIHTIEDAEPIGIKHLTDIMIVAPASGNTMAKLAVNIIDTPATMAVKSHLRNNLPVVIAPCTNDGLGSNLLHIASLINRKNFYFVPFRQDNPILKPYSIAFDSNYIVRTIEYALDGEQIQPLLL